jgi:large subunit ribosomal protein L15
MAEEKKPAAKKPAAKKETTAKAPAKKPAAAAKPAAKAAAKPAAKAPAAKSVAKPAAKAPAAKKETASKAPATAAKKPAAKAPATKAAAKPAAKAPAAKAAAKPAAKAADKPAAKAVSEDKKTEAPAKKATAAPKKAAVKKEVDARPSVVKLHHLRPAPGSKKAKTRVGRGEGSKGKTAGRGTKGTKARYQVRPGFQGGQLTSVMRTPKLRGFNNPFRVEYQVVNVGRLGELYPKGGNVTIEDLVAKGAVRKNQKVKVLADGDVSVALTVTVDKVSKQAADKIAKAGGSITQ